MTVYVDGPITKRAHTEVCVMMADTDAELHAHAVMIKVDERRYLAPPKYDSQYEIGVVNRTKAIEAGAVLVTWRELGCMTMRRRATGELGSPETAEQWCRDQVSLQRPRAVMQTSAHALTAASEAELC